jgi:hypothetical protein
VQYCRAAGLAELLLFDAPYTGQQITRGQPTRIPREPSILAVPAPQNDHTPGPRSIVCKVGTVHPDRRDPYRTVSTANIEGSIARSQ